MRGGYRGKPKPKLPPHLRVTFRLKRVHVNARIQKWMLDELKKKGEVGIEIKSQGAIICDEIDYLPLGIVSKSVFLHYQLRV